jgi:hypothetical protein
MCHSQLRHRHRSPSAVAIRADAGAVVSATTAALAAPIWRRAADCVKATATGCSVSERAAPDTGRAFVHTAEPAQVGVAPRNGKRTLSVSYWETTAVASMQIQSLSGPISRRKAYDGTSAADKYNKIVCLPQSPLIEGRSGCVPDAGAADKSSNRRRYFSPDPKHPAAFGQRSPASPYVAGISGDPG